MTTYGGIEAGGTKWVCAIGHGGPKLIESETFPTTSPKETLARAADFFGARGPLAALGIGSFGPVDLRPGSPAWGHITTTPKPGWAGVDVAGPLGAALGVPVAFDLDVNVAALAESRWGAAAGLATSCYITVGTGIGAGVIADGRLVHGLVHPEVGHLCIPHDTVRDPFAGACPYHGDCLEGLASGEAIRQRWGRPAEELYDEPTVWKLESDYLALGLVNVIYALSPERIVVGGGVAQAPGLLALVRHRIIELLAGYVAVPEVTDAEEIERYVVAPGLGDRAGVLGAIELARDAVARGAEAGGG